MNIPFQTIQWNNVPPTTHPGEVGEAIWRTIQLGNLRLRMVTYSAGYIADHWCTKGHIVHCLEGAFMSELDGGEAFILTAGMTYVVSDNRSSHRSVSAEGLTLLIVDGAFLE